MAASLLVLLLVATAGAVRGDDEVGLPHLVLRGVHDSGRLGHASDAPPHGFTHSCGRFAALVAATANVSEIFSQRIVAGTGTGTGTGGGLTLFCPEDLAVAAFEPKFNSLSAADQLAVVLLHVAAGRYGREQLAAFDSVTVRTLATDAATNKSHVLTVRDDGETVWLWPSPPSRGSGGAARVTTEVAMPGEYPVAVYVVDAVLLPDHLRQRPDEAAACTLSGGYLGLGWLHCTVPNWGALCMAGSGMLGVLTGVLLGMCFCGLEVLE